MFEGFKKLLINGESLNIPDKELPKGSQSIKDWLDKNRPELSTDYEKHLNDCKEHINFIDSWFKKGQNG